MKLKILFVALFVAGVAASIALAAPRDSGTGSTTGTTTTGTTATTTTRHKGDDDHGGKQKGNGCRQVELKGTVAASTLTLTVTKANGAGRGLGSSVTLTVPAGTVKVHGRLCTTASGTTTPAGSTLQLTDLKVGKPAGGER
jgi:hypothetical protein